MKKLLWLLLVPSVLTAQADTVKLSPKELFEASSAWNGIGVVQSYVDFQKDVLSSSNLSVSIVGEQVSTTLNLGYNKSSLSGAWSQSFLTSLNPVWDYYGAGYGITRNTNHVTSTLQAFVSTDFDFQKNITLSVIELFPTKTFGTFGATVNVSKTFWGEYEGAWEGEYIVDETRKLGEEHLSHESSIQSSNNQSHADVHLHLQNRQGEHLTTDICT